MQIDPLKNVYFSKSKMNQDQEKVLFWQEVDLDQKDSLWKARAGNILEI